MTVESSGRARVPKERPALPPIVEEEERGNICPEIDEDEEAEEDEAAARAAGKPRGEGDRGARPSSPSAPRRTRPPGVRARRRGRAARAAAGRRNARSRGARCRGGGEERRDQAQVAARPPRWPRPASGGETQAGSCHHRAEEPPMADLPVSEEPGPNGRAGRGRKPKTRRRPRAPKPERREAGSPSRKRCRPRREATARQAPVGTRRQAAQGRA